MRGSIRAAVIVLVILVVVVYYRPIKSSIEGAVHNWLRVTVEAAAGPACTAANVTLSIGAHSTVGGDSTGYSLVLTNHTSSSCSVSGAPDIFWAAAAHGVYLGHRAAYVGVPQVGANAYHGILPYQQVRVPLTITNVGNWTPSACVPVNVRYVAVRLGSTTWEVPLSTAVCEGLASATVGAVVAG